MRTIMVKKVFKNLISIRDYIVKECIDKGIPLKVVFKNYYMILNPDDLRTKIFNITDRWFKSKFDDREYRLVDYRWAPVSR
jgi:hypothetical protein